jgi:hypothetical protein
MSRYISTQSRIQVSRISSGLRTTAAGIQRFAEECATMIPDYDAEALPTASELRLAITELSESDIQLGQLPAPLIAVVSAYESARVDELDVASLDAIVEQLASDEQTLVTNAFAETLTEMGFKVHENRANDTAMIWAVSGDEAVAVEVDGDGQVGIDHAGCATDACVPVQDLLLEGVATRGISVDMERAITDEHHRREGGSLFTKWHQMAAPEAQPRRDRSAATRSKTVAR